MSNYSRINQQLAQYKIAFERSEKSIEWILDKLDNINIQVEPTDYLTLSHPSWIGNTVLHFIYTKPQLFNLVLHRDVDYTIKNRDDQTIIHLLIQYSGRCCIANQRNVLVVAGINTILSAHVTMKNPTNPCDSNGLSHFHVACMANHIEAVTFFLDNNVPIDHSINSDSPYLAGFTALHLAIRCCNSAVTEILLQRGANIHLKNNERMTAVDMVMANYLKFANEFLLGFFDDTDLPKKHATEEIAKLMLKTISNNNIKITGFSTISCFHIACAMTDSSVAAELLPKENINQSIQNESALWPGYTPLHFAACTNCKTAQILVEKGADLLTEDAKGVTPLELLLERYKMEDISNILSLNSVWNKITRSQNGIELLKFFSAVKDWDQFMEYVNNSFPDTGISVPISSSLWPGFTPMHLLVLFSKIFRSYYEPYKNRYGDESKNYLYMIKKLYDRNESLIAAQDSRGRTVLHLLFRTEINQVGGLLYGMRNKINFNFTSDFVDDENLSLLHIACLRDDKDLVENLLLTSNNADLAYKGKSINNRIETGWTPLHVAVANNNVNVVNVLLKYGADVHSADVNGVTPIHLLVSFNKNWNSWHSWNKTPSNTAESLLSVPNLKDCVIKDIRLSHLHVAYFFRNEDAIRRLIDNGSDISLAINRNPQVAEKSFELSGIVEYLGNTPLQMKPKEHPKCWSHYFEVGNLKKLEDFKENANLLKQAEAKFGLTKLHVACFLKDVEWLKNLLKDNVKINKKLSMDSPRYNGFTPLHAVLEAIEHTIDCDKPGANDHIVRLLLDRGADVTLLNGDQQTPIHMVYDSYLKACYTDYCANVVCLRYLPRIIMMLKAQKDFNVNPICIKGISHFHIACNMNETVTVKKFLERGNVGVNQPIDFFIEFKFRFIAGFTPLHMALNSEKHYIQFASQLETVDLLLKHGADPNFQDSYGNTALHLAERWAIFDRIASSGADAYIVNTKGNTPFDYVRHGYSTKKIINFLKCGYSYNAFNDITKEGYIGIIVNKIPFEELQKFFIILVINMPHVMQVDEKDRTIIHNVVSIGRTRGYQYDDGEGISIVQFATLIEILEKTGCDIDCQDNLGRTALHVAAEFGNSEAISALLMVGADANIQDNNGKTALACHSIQCHSQKRNCEDPPEQCDVLKTLVVHARKLQLCHLDVSQSDKSYIDKECKSIKVSKSFQIELDKIKNMKIGSGLPSLHSFMSEIDIVADYPKISQIKKDSIDEFFHEDQIFPFRVKFSEVAGLINLQYRKAVIRSTLIDDAKTSLNFLANLQIPDLCSHMIIGFLSNSDLKNAITSTNSYMSYRQDSKIISHGESLSQSKKLCIR